MEEAVVIGSFTNGTCRLSKPLSTYPHTKHACNKLQFCERANHWARPTDPAAQEAHSHGPGRVHKTHARYKALTTDCSDQQVTSLVADEILYEHEICWKCPEEARFAGTDLAVQGAHACEPSEGTGAGRRTGTGSGQLQWCGSVCPCLSPPLRLPSHLQTGPSHTVSARSLPHRQPSGSVLLLPCLSPVTARLVGEGLRFR